MARARTLPLAEEKCRPIGANREVLLRNALVPVVRRVQRLLGEEVAAGDALSPEVEEGHVREIRAVSVWAWTGGEVEKVDRANDL